MLLNYQRFPEEDDAPVKQGENVPLVIVPGLFGSISNWRGLARKLSQARTVYVVDQRNHGRSFHADTHTYADMVGDLINLCDHLQLKTIDLAGHSMGGKVAMLLALERPALISRLLVLDIAPKKYSHTHAPFLREMLNIDLSSLRSRKQADDALQDAIPDTATRLFLLQSLSGSPGDYEWRLNLTVLYNYMDDIIGFPDVTANVDVPTLVLSGAESTYFREADKDLAEALFSNVSFKVIEGAGHWLHAEQPEKVLNAMQDYLKR